MADLLLTSRRNFLTRAFGVTVGGAAVTVPIVTVASAAERLEHHMRGVEAAFADLFPTAAVAVRGNCLDGHHAYFAEKFLRGEVDTACAIVMASLTTENGFKGRIVNPPRSA